MCILGQTVIYAPPSNRLTIIPLNWGAYMNANDRRDIFTNTIRPKNTHRTICQSNFMTLSPIWKKKWNIHEILVCMHITPSELCILTYITTISLCFKLYLSLLRNHQKNVLSESEVKRFTKMRKKTETKKMYLQPQNRWINFHKTIAVSISNSQIRMSFGLLDDDMRRKKKAILLWSFEPVCLSANW